MKKIIYIIIALIIIWFGVRFFLGGPEDTWICENGEWVKHGQPSSLKPETSCENQELGMTIRNNKVVEKSEDQRYEIDIEWPIVKNLDNSENVNSFIDEKINKIIDEFKENISDWDVPVDFDSEMKSGLWIKFEKHLVTRDYISLRLTISEYYLGAAHPNNYSLPLNYDIKKSREVALDDFFKVDQDEYLSRISDLALIDLVDQSGSLEMSLDPGMLESGTAPKLENFSNFNLSEDGIIFNFDQYQIAPYAAGEFHVTIPYEELNDIIVK